MNTSQDYAAKLALFLLEQTGSIWGRYRAHMPAKMQRELFGRFLGKGQIIIDGSDESICMKRRVCFGTDWEEVGYTKWAALNPPTLTIEEIIYGSYSDQLKGLVPKMKSAR